MSQIRKYWLLFTEPSTDNPHYRCWFKMNRSTWLRPWGLNRTFYSFLNLNFEILVPSRRMHGVKMTKWQNKMTSNLTYLPGHSHRGGREDERGLSPCTHPTAWNRKERELFLGTGTLPWSQTPTTQISKSSSIGLGSGVYIGRGKMARRKELKIPFSCTKGNVVLSFIWRNWNVERLTEV